MQNLCNARTTPAHVFLPEITKTQADKFRYLTIKTLLNLRGYALGKVLRQILQNRL